MEAQHPTSPTRGRITEASGELPMSFEANKGQTDEKVKFLSRGRAPAWSRNGRQIYFSSFRPETNLFENNFVMNEDGSDVTRLTFDDSTLSVVAVR